MCGIAAIYSPREPIRSETLKVLQDVARHRGPDDEGVALFRGNQDSPLCFGGNDSPLSLYASGLPYAPKADRPLKIPTGTILALAHRRLSILDLTAAGHQPMCWANGRYWITYNGEIYNYVELRNELRSLGHEFLSSSDTEVILCAYHTWGTSCLHRFNGMFAFVLYDREQCKLFAARDRFGVKPLYYRVGSEGTVCFASEIKQLTALPDSRSRLNHQRAYDFLNWNVIDHTDETLFAGIFQLRNGEATEFPIHYHAQPVAPANGKLPVWQWYQLTPKPFAGNAREAASSYLDLLDDAVRLRLRADVPIGSCLSGGLDSSSVVCLINRCLKEQATRSTQKVFSAVSDILRFDESRHVNEVVTANALDSHRVTPTVERLFDELDHITWHQDEPFGSTSIYAQWCVFRLISERGVKVVLDGQGADEQLAGYHNYFGAFFGSLARGGHWHTLAREIWRTNKLHDYSIPWALQQLLNNLLPESLRQQLRRWGGRSAVSSPYLNLHALRAQPTDPYLTAGAAKAQSVNQMSHAQLTGASLQMLLHCEDRDSMGHSIEARVPFLDYRLVEFALGLPDEFKLKNGWTKKVLRDAMIGILPESIRSRVDKMGFVTPEEVWVRDQNPQEFRTRLKDAMDISDRIIRDSALEYFDDIVAGNKPYNHLVWRLISFGNWLKVFKVSI